MTTAIASSGLNKRPAPYRVLDVKSWLRKVNRCTLGRYAGLLMVALPFLGLALYVYTHQHESIRYLFVGRGCLIFFSLSLAGLLAVRLRRHFLHLLDRDYFHEANDFQLLPVEIVERSRMAGSIDELGEILTGEINRALQLTKVSVFAVNPSSGFLVSTDQDYSSLSCASPLAKLVAGDTRALEIDENAQSLLERLPLEDRRWLKDGAFQLLLPILGSDGFLLGAIALGKKKNDLPFSSADRQLLTTIAASAASNLEKQLSHTPSPLQGVGTAAAAMIDSGRVACDPESELAAECQDCHRIFQPGSIFCDRCGGYLETSPVPYLLRDTFRLEERIGLGGMGVVYRAFDLALGRTVAIKTLPSISPQNASRLRCEARVVAMVQHPHLALIYGVETWRGIPMLVFEYMEGGTLKDRIWTAPVALREAIELGVELVDVLDQIHAVGILHRDIKPSNIGFSKEDKPKLLDFGLAHVLSDSRRRDAKPTNGDDPAGELPEHGPDGLSSSSATRSRHVVGTPAYICPESLKGATPDPSFDLWGMGIVLYEALSGCNPVLGESVKETLTRVRAANIPDIREKRTDLTEPVAQFFRVVLSRSKARRPRTATEMRDELEVLKKRLGM